MENLPDALTQLEARVEALEQRVCALEHPVDAPPATVRELMREPVLPAGVPNGREVSKSITTGAFVVLGKGMLGIAGAYLLRAVAETSVLPRAAMAAVAIAYALAWLVPAWKTRGDEWLKGTIYGFTSVLILVPMLWELTLRFSVLSVRVTACVLAGYVTASSAMAWKRASAPVLWVSYGAVAGIALALAIATHSFVPFVLVLLLMVLMTECGAAWDRKSGVRILAAVAADVAIWALIYIYAGPENARTDYPVVSKAELIAPGMALFLIQGTVAILGTVKNRRAITAFEVIQTTIAFLLAASGLMCFGSPAVTTGFGWACLVLSVCCYAAVLMRFVSVADGRNAVVFATWSAALFLAGSLMGLASTLQPLWLGAASIAASLAGARLNRLALELHGALFLVAAAVISGTANTVGNALTGAIGSGTGWLIYVLSGCAVVCSVAVETRPAESWKARGLSLLFVGTATALVAALMVRGLMSVTSLWMIPGAHHLAFLRTLTVCVVAIALAFGGSRWQRVELTWIGYGALGLLVVKLISEDLRHGHMAFVAGSIFLFAVTLIVVPRVGRAGASQHIGKLVS